MKIKYINPEIKKVLFLLPVVFTAIIIFFSISKDDELKKGEISVKIPDAEDVALFSKKTEAYKMSQYDSIKKANCNESINLNIGNLLNNKETKIEPNSSDSIAETNLKKLFSKDTTITKTSKQGIKQLENLLASLETKEKPKNKREQKIIKKPLSAVVTTPKVKPKRKQRKKSNVSENAKIAQNNDNLMIRATIYGEQTVYNHSRVKLILQKDIIFEDKIIPKNTFIYGEAVLGRERVQINIRSIVYNEEILPIKLKVLDNDGIVGIFIPGGISQEISKEASGEVLNQVRSTKTGFGSQLLTATQNVAKKWQGRDFAVIPNDYKVFLNF